MNTIIQTHIFDPDFRMDWQTIGSEPFNIRGNDLVPSPVASQIADIVAETDKLRGLVEYQGVVWSFRIIPA